MLFCIVVCVLIALRGKKIINLVCVCTPMQNLTSMGAKMTSIVSGMPNVYIK